MLPHSLLKKFQGQKKLIISLIQIHILLLLLAGIILFMGSLKKSGGAPFSLFFPPSSTEKIEASDTPVERKARFIPPPENPPATP